MEQWCSGGRAMQKRVIVCYTDQDPEDSSRKVPPVSFNHLLPTFTWYYLSHFQWQCFLHWGWYTSWHSCGKAGMFWWRSQCWDSHPSPAGNRTQRENPFLSRFGKITSDCISGSLKSLIVSAQIFFRSSFLLAPFLHYTSHSLAPFLHRFNIIYLCTCKPLLIPPSPFLRSCSFLNPSCMMPGLWQEHFDLVEKLIISLALSVLRDSQYRSAG